MSEPRVQRLHIVTNAPLELSNQTSRSKCSDTSKTEAVRRVLAEYQPPTGVDDTHSEDDEQASDEQGVGG